ncbi:MAG: allantoinase AllB, partial [Chloroflexota bacterium]|nr:allantoinase AllB [Chloroflexota bacterium]
MVHASGGAAVDAVVRERGRGAEITVETCPHYLLFDEADFARLGPALKCAPPVRDIVAREALWRRLMEGTIDAVASDHSPCPPDHKRRGDDDIWLAWGGVAGIQSTLPAMLAEGVHRRGLP